MAESIQFTVMQSLSVEALLGQQRGTVKDLIEVYDLAKKIHLDNRSDYIKETPSGTLVDLKAAAEAEPRPIELEKAERRKLLELLDGHRDFAPGDLEWILPLKKQLEKE